jgi:hypothetical protein
MGQLKSLKSTYIKIALLFAAWGSMVLLRAMDVIPDEPAPIEYVYQRPEKKIEKKIEQRDTVYMMTGDWVFPFNFPGYNYPFNGCGGVIYMDQWGYAGYGFPSWGGYPLGNNFVFDAGFDSTRKDTLNIQNQDSSLVASSDSSSILIVSENSNHESNSIKHFFQNKRKDLLERKNKRKEKRMLRNSI